MVKPEKRTSATETGQIPRALVEAYQNANDALRESHPDEDINSITGSFRLKQRSEGKDVAKEKDDPVGGDAPTSAPQR
jgi:hypothetical protein